MGLRTSWIYAGHCNLFKSQLVRSKKSRLRKYCAFGQAKYKRDDTRAAINTLQISTYVIMLFLHLLTNSAT